MKISIILAIVMMMFAGMQKVKCQSKKLTPEDKRLIIDLTNSLNACNTRVETLSLLEKDTALLNNAIRSLLVLRELSVKDSADQQQQISLLNTQIGEKNKSIDLLKVISEEQEKMVKRLGNPKKWAISLFGGYGVGGSNFGTTVFGAGISRTIFAF